MRKFKKKSSKKKVKKINGDFSKELVSKNQAIRKLQVSNTDFKRLCLLKGIYPQPEKKKQFNPKKTFYFKKDINSIVRDPILTKFRETKTYLKKKKKALSTNNKIAIEKIKLKKPIMNYEHLIKERYPTFESALADLDDPLSLICLFLSLPSRAVKGYGPQRQDQLRAVYSEFMHAVTYRRALNKVFVSIKGFYFSAKFDEQEIVWMQPHCFVGDLPDKVDFFTLVTLLDFYGALLGFVNFKLYSDMGLEYPPSLETGTLNPLEIKTNERLLEVVESNQENANKEINPNRTTKSLFEGMIFLLMKETPYDILSFIINSFGGHTIKETDLVSAQDGHQSQGLTIQQVLKSITHKISDRGIPATANTELGSHGNDSAELETFETLQPQWVFDSVNEGLLLPVERYSLGQKCPDHLSPFVDKETDSYVPAEERYRDDIKKMKGQCDSSLLTRATDLEENVSQSEKEIGLDEKQKKLGKILMKGKDKRLFKALKQSENMKRLNTESKMKKLNEMKDDE